MPYCPKCGQEVPDDAVYCPKCGTRIEGGKREHYEKEEKREKGEKHEASDISGAIVGGLVLIWLGITFYLAEIGYIKWSTWTAYFLLGLGAILIIQALIKYLTSPYKSSAYGIAIGGLVIASIGLVMIYGLTVWWPFIFIVLGIIVIISSITSRKHSPRVR
ncbi:MAG: zinc ribbon domain-containing protein [Nitrososphaeria archaeon]|nr:zinc ribbon domain-containing protein [Nitrososphaeria archaeon]